MREQKKRCNNLLNVVKKDGEYFVILLSRVQVESYGLTEDCLVKLVIEEVHKKKEVKGNDNLVC